MKADAYQVITDRIIGLLQQGVIPWQKPWQTGQHMPRNLISKREYRGVNVFLLHAMMYESPIVRKLERGDSCSFSIVILQQASESFLTMDGPFGWEVGDGRADNLVLQSLMVAFGVIMQIELRDGAAQRRFTDQN